MPNIKSAIKRVKIANKKTLENSRIKSATKTAIKKYEVANANKDPKAVELLEAAKKQIDHAYSKGVLKKNTAARKKSRLDMKLSVARTEKKAKAPKKEAAKTETVKKEEVAKKPAEKKTTAKKTTTTKKTATKTTKKTAEK